MRRRICGIRASSDRVAHARATPRVPASSRRDARAPCRGSGATRGVGPRARGAPRRTPPIRSAVGGNRRRMPDPPEGRPHANVVDGVPRADRAKWRMTEATATPTPRSPRSTLEPRRIAPRQEGGRGHAPDARLGVARDLRADPRALPLADPAELRAREVEGPAARRRARRAFSPAPPRGHGLAARPGRSAGPATRICRDVSAIIGRRLTRPAGRDPTMERRGLLIPSSSSPRARPTRPTSSR